MRYLVEDGGHLKVDEPYAEVEVMKMCMPLLAPASGTLHWRMPEGQAMMAGQWGCHQSEWHLISAWVGCRA